MGIVDLDKADYEDLVEDVSSQELEEGNFAKKEDNALFKDRQRHEKTKEVFHSVFIQFVRLAAFGAIIVLAVRVLHLVMPSGWAWLDTDQIQSIDTILFSGLIGGVVSRYRRYIVPQAMED